MRADKKKKKSVGSKINELLPMKLPTDLIVLLPRGRNPLKDLERAKGIEPSTPTLARSCSTAELHPLPSFKTSVLRLNNRSPAIAGDGG